MVVFVVFFVLVLFGMMWDVLWVLFFFWLLIVVVIIDFEMGFIFDFFFFGGLMFGFVYVVLIGVGIEVVWGVVFGFGFFWLLVMVYCVLFG